jgi:hypothetical protein
MLARIALLSRMRLKIVVSQLLLRQDQLLLLSATHGVLLLVHRAEDAALAGAKMRKGTRVITLTRPLSSSAFSVIDTRNYRMSWGLATAFFHVKK